MGDCGRYYDEGLETSASLAPYDGNLTLVISHFPTNTYSTTVFLETKPASFLQTQCENGVFGSIVFLVLCLQANAPTTSLSTSCLRMKATWHSRWM